MLRTTWIRGRRGAVLGTTAAAVCLGGVLASCGGGGGDGYVAVGAAGGPPRTPGTAVGPTDGVRLVPLDPSSAADDDRAPGMRPQDGTDTPQPAPGTPRTSGSPSPPAESVEPGRTEAGSPSPTSTAVPTAPREPAALNVSDPVREPTDRRWCEKVTLVFRNTGATAVRSGTVTFGTHVIDVLGTDWATVESTEELPAPLGPGARTERTWTVCVEEMRVPLGMHVETRDVSVRWR